VPAEWERRQTLTGAERFITTALKTREQEVLAAEDRLRAREHELFTMLRERAASHVPALQRAAAALGRLDAEIALAEAAARYGWTRPVMEDSDRILLEGARHPVVERLLPRGQFVPNHCRLDGGTRQILLLTGPNMGGKSTYLRQVALAVLLAQCGSFVPATRAEIGLVDRLITRVGAGDRLGAGQSTFMVEMSETADILRSATSRSLVLLDEVGRGTATYDGLALAWAATEFLHSSRGARPRTIFATHYHELTQLADTLPRLANVHVAVAEREGTVVFLHRIAEGARTALRPACRRAGGRARERHRTRARSARRTRERAHWGPSRRCQARWGEETRRAAAVAAVRHPAASARGGRALDPDALTPRQALDLLLNGRRRVAPSTAAETSARRAAGFSALTHPRGPAGQRAGAAANERQPGAETIRRFAAPPPARDARAGAASGLLLGLYPRPSSPASKPRPHLDSG
jgi:hypothetical protein